MFLETMKIPQSQERINYISLCWALSPLSLAYSGGFFLFIKDVRFSQRPFLVLLSDSGIHVLILSYVVNSIYWFAYVKLCLYLWNVGSLIMANDPSVCSQMRFLSVLLNMFLFVVNREIALLFCLYLVLVLAQYWLFNKYYKAFFPFLTLWCWLKIFQFYWSFQRTNFYFLNSVVLYLFHCSPSKPWPQVDTVYLLDLLRKGWVWGGWSCDRESPS